MGRTAFEDVGIRKEGIDGLEHGNTVPGGFQESRTQESVSGLLRLRPDHFCLYNGQTSSRSEVNAQNHQHGLAWPGIRLLRYFSLVWRNRRTHSVGEKKHTPNNSSILIFPFCFFARLLFEDGSLGSVTERAGYGSLLRHLQTSHGRFIYQLEGS